jgi:hypothetical protein
MAMSSQYKLGDHYKVRKGVMSFFFKNAGYPSGEFPTVSKACFF